MYVFTRLQNLPLSAGPSDIRAYFSGLSIVHVQIFGGRSGEAFIVFSTDQDARLAIARSGGIINGQVIQLQLSTREDMIKVLERKIQQIKASGIELTPYEYRNAFRIFQSGSCYQTFEIEHLYSHELRKPSVCSEKGILTFDKRNVSSSECESNTSDVRFTSVNTFSQQFAEPHGTQLRPQNSFCNMSSCTPHIPLSSSNGFTSQNSSFNMSSYRPHRPLPDSNSCFRGAIRGESPFLYGGTDNEISKDVEAYRKMQNSTSSTSPRIPLLPLPSPNVNFRQEMRKKSPLSYGQTHMEVSNPRQEPGNSGFPHVGGRFSYRQFRHKRFRSSSNSSVPLKRGRLQSNCP